MQQYVVMWPNLWTSAGKFMRKEVLPSLPDDETDALLDLEKPDGLPAIAAKPVRRAKKKGEGDEG